MKHSNLSSLWQNYVTSNLNLPPDSRDAIRVKYINTFSILGVATLMGFGIGNALDGDVLTAYVEIAFGLLALFNLFLLRIWKKITLAIYIIMLVMFFPLCLLIYTGGIAGTGFLWMFPYLVVGFFLHGKRAGWGWCFAIIAYIIVTPFLNTQITQNTYYTPLALRQLIAAMIVVSGLLYFYEDIRHQTRKLVDKSNQELKSANQKLAQEAMKHRLASQEIQEKLKQIEIKNQELQKAKQGMLNLLEDQKELQDALQQQKATVEQQVEERTKQLEEKTADLKAANDKVSQGWFNLQKEKAYLMSSIDNIHVGYILVNAEGKIVMTNQAVGHILGHDSTMSLEQKFNQVFDFKNLLKTCREQRTAIGPNIVTYNNKMLEIFANPVMTAIGTDEVAGTVILIEDVTEQKNLEKTKEEFFAMATHELRTPLTAIRGNADNIGEIFADKMAQDQDFKEMVTDIQSASLRLLNLVNDLLDMSKLELGKISFENEQFNLPKIIKEVIAEVESTAKGKNLYLRLHLPETTIPLVYADPGRVKQVLVNLIGNAVKFTDQGGITINLMNEEKQIKVQVTDTGKGISSDQQSHVFGKFKQLQDKRQSATPGTGLGLYISRLLVEGMNGQIYLESSIPGKGTTFTFTLPVAE